MKTALQSVLFCGGCHLPPQTVVVKNFNTPPTLPHSPLLPLPPALQEDDRRPCSVIRCLSVLESSSDRLQEAVFMPDDGDHRKQKCLFVPPGLGMSTISRGQYQILPSSSPNTHSCVRSGGILHQQRDKQAKAKPHTVLCWWQHASINMSQCVCEMFALKQYVKLGLFQIPNRNWPHL